MRSNDDHLGDFLDIFERRRHHPAAIADEASVSYGDLALRADKLAAGLRAEGLRPGDRFAVDLPNGIDFLVCQVTACRAGFTLVPLNRALPASDLDHLLAMTRPRLVIDEQGGLPSSGDIRPPDHTDAREGRIVFFTSGTTGRPKGVSHLFSSLIGDAFRFNALTGLTADDRMYHVMAMAYMGGVLNTVLCPLAAEATIVLGPRFEATTAADFWTRVIRHEATTLWLSPTIAAFLTRLHRDPEVADWTAENLRNVLVGTAPLPLAVARGFEETFGATCLESYGLTETCLIASNHRDTPPRTGSVGRVVDTIDVEARGPSGATLGAGEEGELHVKSPYSLEGYLDPETGSPEPATTNGWFATGDIGHLDEDGNLFITGRAKDLIIRGGMNISPRAVEEVLFEHPEVVEAAVVGEPHEFWGEEVVAYVVAEDPRPEVGHLRAWCRDRLADHSQPANFHFVAELPRSSTGKIQRHRLPPDRSSE